jgi:3,4-dihydroxy 2-butanone 4-phosphate synthase/GTP cyclohydrolase II
VLVLLREFNKDWLSRRLEGADADETDATESAQRLIGVGSQILRDLGVRRMVVLANTQARLVGLEGYGLTIDGWRGFSS